jgi:hypothetical protein
MATEVAIAGTSSRAKVRSPWGVLGLTIVTFGIYHIFWWYFVNRELRDLGRATRTPGLGESPGLSCLAATFGAFTLYIATVWTYVAGTKRVQTAQGAVGRTDTLSGWLMFGLAFFTIGIGCPIYFQSELNKVWATMPPANSPPPPTATVISPDSDLDRLQKLAALKETGALTDAEFEAEKAKILV